MKNFAKVNHSFLFFCQEHFEAKLQDFSNKLVVVDFHAVWCGPCRMISPALKVVIRGGGLLC